MPNMFRVGQQVVLQTPIDLRSKGRSVVPAGTKGTIVSKFGFGSIFVKFDDFGRCVVFPKDIQLATKLIPAKPV